MLPVTHPIVLRVVLGLRRVAFGVHRERAEIMRGGEVAVIARVRRRRALRAVIEHVLRAQRATLRIVAGMMRPGRGAVIARMSVVPGAGAVGAAHVATDPAADSVVAMR